MKNGKALAKKKARAKANGKALAARPAKQTLQLATWKEALIARYPKASLGELQLHVMTMKRLGLDQISQHGHLIPFWDRETHGYKNASVVGIDGWRSIAEGAGGYAGKVSVTYGIAPTKDSPYREGVSLTQCLALGHPNPITCKVVTARIVAGVRVETPGEVTWASRAQFDKDGNLKGFWKKDKDPYGQLEKCAEAKSLRAAAPRLFSDVMIPEEVPGERGEEPRDATPKRKALEVPSGLPSKPGEVAAKDYSGDAEWKKANAALHAEQHRLGFKADLLHLYLHQREKVGSLKQMKPETLRAWVSVLKELQVGSAEYDKAAAKLEAAGEEAAK